MWRAQNQRGSETGAFQQSKQNNSLGFHQERSAATNHENLLKNGGHNYRHDPRDSNLYVEDHRYQPQLVSIDATAQYKQHQNSNHQQNTAANQSLAFPPRAPSHLLNQSVVAKSEAAVVERRKSPNSLMLGGNKSSSSSRTAIKVSIRVRPTLPREATKDECIYFPSREMATNLEGIKVADGQHFIESQYDRVFSQRTPQEDIYEFVQDSVSDVLNGFNSTIFAYGQTGSGKTFTMFGPHWDDNSGSRQNTLGGLRFDGNIDRFLEEKAQLGIIPRSIEQIFYDLDQKITAKIQAGESEQAAMSEFTIYCSFLQIYNEKLFDLLQDRNQNRPLNIREDKYAGIFVEGQSEYAVQNAAECFTLLKRGEASRITRQTKANIHSSRSHTIFQILIESNRPNRKGMLFRGKLNLCDLAGSEKIQKEEIMDASHLLELKRINMSLSALGMVIQKLAQGKSKAHISYRDSKITRLLQDSLGGNTRTTLIATVSPIMDHTEETISTLKFADRAKKIMTKVSANQISAADDALVNKLQREIQHLKDILNLKRRGGAQDLHQQLLILKEENSKLKSMVGQGDEADRLRHENQIMRHELTQLRTTQSPLPIMGANQSSNGGSSMAIGYSGMPGRQINMQGTNDSFLTPGPSERQSFVGETTQNSTTTGANYLPKHLQQTNDNNNTSFALNSQILALKQRAENSPSSNEQHIYHDDHNQRVLHNNRGEENGNFFMTETEMGTLGNEGPITKNSNQHHPTTNTTSQKYNNESGKNHDKMQIRSNDNSQMEEISSPHQTTTNHQNIKNHPNNSSSHQHQQQQQYYLPGESKSLNMSTVSGKQDAVSMHAMSEQIGEDVTSKVSDLQKYGAWSIKGNLVNNGRCPKCTLKPPCKHYDKLEDLPPLKTDKKALPPLPPPTLPNDVLTRQLQKQKQDQLFTEMKKAESDPITAGLVQSYLRRHQKQQSGDKTASTTTGPPKSQLLPPQQESVASVGLKGMSYDRQSSQNLRALQNAGHQSIAPSESTSQLNNSESRKGGNTAKGRSPFANKSFGSSGTPLQKDQKNPYQKLQENAERSAQRQAFRELEIGKNQEPNPAHHQVRHSAYPGESPSPLLPTQQNKNKSLGYRPNQASQRGGQLALMQMGSEASIRQPFKMTAKDQFLIDSLNQNSQKYSLQGSSNRHRSINDTQQRNQYRQLEVNSNAAPRYMNGTGGGGSSSLRKSTDQVQVRIRGKNNFVETKTGSVTRTMDDLDHERKKKQEIAKAANRLRMLEKLEDYREQKMAQEIELLEEERQREEEELRRARDKERKYNRYLEKQREKLAEHQVKKSEDVKKKRKEDLTARRKQIEDQRRKEKQHDAKKKMIQEYKAKKDMAAELLANADLEDLDSYADDGYNSGNNGLLDEQQSEGDASKYLDKMINLYQNKPGVTDSDSKVLGMTPSSMGAISYEKRRPPPAVQ